MGKTPIKIKICKVCGKKFYRKSFPNAIMCEECKRKEKESKRKLRANVCKICGRKWNTYDGHQEICEECKDAGRNPNENWTRPAGFNIDKLYHCANCGKEFKPYSITIKDGRFLNIAGWQTCSFECTKVLIEKEKALMKRMRE